MVGKGATRSYSRKGKLNTQSSTEMELVFADMFMPDLLWSLHFIQEQGYETECMGLYQDNISTQLLMKNGLTLSGKKMKHIKAKFFFVKGRVDNRELKVIDCPGEGMWVDVMTKPLQGMAFRTMRLELVNCPVDYEDLPEMCEDIEMKKRVGVQRTGEENRTQPSSKTVTWKRVFATPFRALHECVEKSGDNLIRRETDRCP
jgi:hypothetical protein